MFGKKNEELAVNDRVTVDGVPGKIVGHTDTGTPLVALAEGFLRGVPLPVEGRVKRA